MAWETRDNSGSMFKNNRKETDKHPDMTGEALIEGKTFWVNAWRKVDKNGNPWYSFAFKEKEQRSSAPAKSSKPVPDDDDSIPF
jgi:hypothetical protein